MRLKIHTDPNSLPLRKNSRQSVLQMCLMQAPQLAAPSPPFPHHACLWPGHLSFTQAGSSLSLGLLGSVLPPSCPHVLLLPPEAPSFSVGLVLTRAALILEFPSNLLLLGASWTTHARTDLSPLTQNLNHTKLTLRWSLFPSTSEG